MTSRQLYEGVLIELNKENAPNILLEDFNYFANKAINNYINKRYNIYDINQQTTDDLRVLKATAMLKPRQITDYNGLTMAGKDKMATYEVVMPSDYLHILNCICVYKVNKTYKCYNAGDTWRAAATRLTADMYSQVLDNFWNKPTYKRPYYYIHNVNSVKDESFENRATISTNPYSTAEEFLIGDLPKASSEIKNVQQGVYVLEKTAYVPELDFATSGKYNVYVYLIECDLNGTPNENATETLKVGYPKKMTLSEDKKHRIGTGTDVNKINDTHKYKYSQNDDSISHTYGKDGLNNFIYQGEGLPDTIKIRDANGSILDASNRERGQGIRYGNVSEVRLEIRYGTDVTIFELTDVYVDYIKAPQNIRLTQEEIDLTEDTSQMLEYPDYVCQEIINELVHLVMENISDQRLQTHPVVTLSIANPAQALAPQAQGLSAQ